MSLKVLYVEDELNLANIVRDTLISSGYDVSLISDGAEVMEEARRFNPDICLLDVMLPNIDGFNLGRSLSQEKPDLPIIFLTAKSQQQDVLQGLRSGGNDYIKKPFSMEELMLRMDNLISLTQASANTTCEEPITIGSFLFDSRKQKLIFENEETELSYREVEVLQFFVKHLDGVVSRKDLLVEIWGDDSFYNSRNLDVYMRKIRSYLQPDPNIAILTLRGVGYKLLIDQSDT